MVGEIRDVETAEISVRAAMTGHLVLSTLHTNSAVNSITRLIDMGVEPFLLASSLSCIVAQRLVRKICDHCIESYDPSEEERALFAEYGVEVGELKRGAGCGNCGRTGYKGRLAIHEVLVVDEELRSMILRTESDSVYMAYASKQGMVPMLHDGLLKVKAGRTTVSEVFRVTN
jgi:type IV pilus assembly protein PilB